MAATTFSFVCLPDAAIWNLGISSHAKCLYAALLAHRNRKTGLCNPQLVTLAERLGKSLSTIRRALAQLRRAGMIIIHRSLFGNQYELATPDQWQTTISATDCALKCERCAALTRERTQRSNVTCPERRILIEPDLFNHTKSTAAAAGAVVTHQQAAAATFTSGECKPEKPTPPAAQAFHVKQTDSPVGPAVREAAEQIAVELMGNHPEPGNLPKAIAEAEKVLASSPGEVPATVESLRVSHASWRARWAEYVPGRFVPQLWRWIHDGDWRNVPTERKGVKRETWVERREREYQESNEETYRMYAELGAWSILREYGDDDFVEAWRAKVETAA